MQEETPDDSLKKTAWRKKASEVRSSQIENVLTEIFIKQLDRPKAVTHCQAVASCAAVDDEVVKQCRELLASVAAP